MIRHARPEAKNELKELKKLFKKIMKNNIRLYEKNEFYHINKLIKEKNSDNFFKKVKKTTNKKDVKIEMSIELIAQHYNLIFNDKLNVDPIVITDINNGIKDIDIKNFYPISLEIFTRFQYQILSHKFLNAFFFINYQF
jgi:hypothetical protein